MGECVQTGGVGSLLPMKDSGFQMEPYTNVIQIQRVLVAQNGDGVGPMFMTAKTTAQVAQTIDLRERLTKRNKNK